MDQYVTTVYLAQFDRGEGDRVVAAQRTALGSHGSTSPPTEPTPAWASKEVLTVDEVASILGWGRTKTYGALRRGDIPSRRVGEKGYLITVRAFRRWLEGGTA